MMKFKNKAFTLVELLVVISIIALLMGILMPALSKAKHQANRILCRSNLHTVGLVFELYANDFQGKYPNNTLEGGLALGNWTNVRVPVRDYLNKFDVKGGKAFYCPEYSKVYKLKHEKHWNEPRTDHAEPLYFIGYSLYAAQPLALDYSTRPVEQQRIPPVGGDNEGYLAPRRAPLPPFTNSEKDMANRPLAMDECMWYGRGAGGAFWNYTPHREGGKTPEGTNVVYGDGHADWHPFKDRIIVFYQGGSNGYIRYY